MSCKYRCTNDQWGSGVRHSTMPEYHHLGYCLQCNSNIPGHIPRLATEHVRPQVIPAMIQRLGHIHRIRHVQPVKATLSPMHEMPHYPPNQAQNQQNHPRDGLRQRQSVRRNRPRRNRTSRSTPTTLPRSSRRPRRPKRKGPLHSETDDRNRIRGCLPIVPAILAAPSSRPKCETVLPIQSCTA
jgi:hypothetical protein